MDRQIIKLLILEMEKLNKQIIALKQRFLTENSSSMNMNVNNDIQNQYENIIDNYLFFKSQLKRIDKAFSIIDENIDFLNDIYNNKKES